MAIFSKIRQEGHARNLSIQAGETTQMPKNLLGKHEVLGSILPTYVKSRHGGVCLQSQC